MNETYLKEGEYVGHEVYFPGEDPPQEVMDRLKAVFCRSKDGFYISREELEQFRILAHPHKVDIMQDNIILGGGNYEETMNAILDMINQLKVAGVHGIDNYIVKIKELEL